ncbi:oxidoreductase [Pontibacillus halophilus JSM 076056 = DSM 19796]|uniref:Oxidoreductase n=1 Tax=Pontibacillus halophilus JSM 076056 = DSM 19796 TaxID=1385510 RepID=A0A0A5GJG5_9BACI|nr:oxidoreductase [Pontibacillus halophilus]KGX91358.1 oxidoreductase [Pontibacillus halophilus JSM 076056 = DSM 19796]
MSTIRVGLVGFGFSGATFHAPFFQRLHTYEITQVASSNEEKVHKALGDKVHVTTVEELVTSDCVDLVVIATPNELHFPIAESAIRNGKHVVIDKPFVVTAEEGRTLIDLAKEHNVKLSVYQNRRYDSDFLTAKKLIEEGALGTVVQYESHFDRYRPEVRQRWREQPGKGAGILFDLGAHLIDQAISLFGKPEDIKGDVRIQREEGTVDDYFHVRLDYGTLQVILHSSSLTRHLGPKLQVHGTTGSYVKYGMDQQEAMLKEGKGPGDEGWGEEDPSTNGTLVNDEYPEGIKYETELGSYETFYTVMANAILHNAAVPVEPEEALRTIEIIEELFAQQ